MTHLLVGCRPCSVHSAYGSGNTGPAHSTGTPAQEVHNACHVHAMTCIVGSIHMRCLGAEVGRDMHASALHVMVVRMQEHAQAMHALII